MKRVGDDAELALDEDQGRDARDDDGGGERRAPSQADRVELGKCDLGGLGVHGVNKGPLHGRLPA